MAAGSGPRIMMMLGEQPLVLEFQLSNIAVQRNVNNNLRKRILDHWGRAVFKILDIVSVATYPQTPWRTVGCGGT